MKMTRSDEEKPVHSMRCTWEGFAPLPRVSSKELRLTIHAHLGPAEELEPPGFLGTGPRPCWERGQQA
ncbi:hypothetical protein I79_009739 [Cricetulus griseus]|uniref:Uncharacterized protein n=1 Tax=Cricetulus griseus TaxID=10029 RepID=G3HGK1_CRIGR|nr:hypothetical protein I79_009739 [Cricetulus griseus]